MNGKMWRLLKNWYEGGCGQVKVHVHVNGRLSERFQVSRGGSVLSPALFLLVIGPLLRATGIGLSLNGYYAGGFFHADDFGH